MCGKRCLTFFLVSICAFAQETLAQELWKLVAQSHVILVGIPTVPVDKIEAAQRTGKHDYVNVRVHVEKCLKGGPYSGAIDIRYFTGPASYRPAPRALIESSGNRSVLFLVPVDEKGVQGLYFAGYTPKALQRYSDKLVIQLDAEVLAQKRIVSEFGRNFRAENEPSYTKVQALINAMVNSRTEEKAFADLEAMGKSAVPAMIMLMDDRRELPIRHIALRNPSATFEAFRQYGPQVVVDAVTAILNQITGETFGQTENGGSERERKAAIDGWRVYLYKTQFHAGASTS